MVQDSNVISKRDITVNSTIKTDKLPQWTNIKNELCEMKDINSDLIIWASCSRIIEPEVVIPSEDGGLYVFPNILYVCFLEPVPGNNVRKLTVIEKLLLKQALEMYTKIYYFEIKN